MPSCPDLLAALLTPTYPGNLPPPDYPTALARIAELEDELAESSPIMEALDAHGWSAAEVAVALRRSDDLDYLEEECIDLATLKKYPDRLADLQSALDACVEQMEQLEELLGDDINFAAALSQARAELEEK